jgi:arylsulfatase A-like enzyme
MIEALDDAVGNVIEALKKDHLLDNTLIILTSDNGGAAYHATDNAPLAGGIVLHIINTKKIAYKGEQS